MCCLICRNKCLSNMEPTHPHPPKKDFFYIKIDWLIYCLFYQMKKYHLQHL